MHKVVVTDYPFEALDIEAGILQPLGCELVARKQAPPPVELARLVSDADHILTVFAPVDAAVIAAMQKARVIVRYGVGVDNVDLDAARAQGIPVCNVPDYGTEEVADHALLLTLALQRNLYRALNAVRGGSWSWHVAEPVHRLRGQRFGIVGCGRSGTAALPRIVQCPVCSPVIKEQRDGAQTVLPA